MSESLQCNAGAILSFTPDGDALAKCLFRSKAVMAMLRIKMVTGNKDNWTMGMKNGVDDEKYFQVLRDSLSELLFCKGYKVTEESVTTWEKKHGPLFCDFGAYGVWCSTMNFCLRPSRTEDDCSDCFIYSRQCEEFPSLDGGPCSACANGGKMYGSPSHIPEVLVDKKTHNLLMTNLLAGEILDTVDKERLAIRYDDVERQLLKVQKEKSKYKTQLHEARPIAETIHKSLRKEAFQTSKERSEYEALASLGADLIAKEIDPDKNIHAYSLAKELFESEYRYLGKHNRAGGKAGIHGQYSEQLLSWYTDKAWRMGKKAYEQERQDRGTALPCWDTLRKFRNKAKDGNSGLHHLNITAAHLHAKQVLEQRSYARGLKGKTHSDDFMSCFILAGDAMGLVDKFQFSNPERIAHGGVTVEKHFLDTLFHAYANNKKNKESPENQLPSTKLEDLAKKADIEHTIATQLMAIQLLNPSIPGFKYTVWTGMTTSLSGYELSNIILSVITELSVYGMYVSGNVMDCCSTGTTFSGLDKEGSAHTLVRHKMHPRHSENDLRLSLQIEWLLSILADVL
jgi:hypothetical protein